MEARKTSFQKFAIRKLHELLNDANFRRNSENPGFSDYINVLIRQYPEITNSNERTWKNVKYYKKYFKLTERAVKALDDYKGPDKDEWKAVHFEHIMPGSCVLKLLLDLGDTPAIKEIEEIMNDSEIIILSKEEAELLDGHPNKIYPLEGKMFPGKGLRAKGMPQERLAAINAEIAMEFKKNNTGDIS